MSIAEGYTISVQCDGAHAPGLEVRREVYGYTKQKAHAELRRIGWRLGANFTAYCPACSLMPPARAAAALAGDGSGHA